MTLDHSRDLLAGSDRERFCTPQTRSNQATRQTGKIVPISSQSMTGASNSAVNRLLLAAPGHRQLMNTMLRTLRAVSARSARLLLAGVKAASLAFAGGADRAVRAAVRADQVRCGTTDYGRSPPCRAGPLPLRWLPRGHERQESGGRARGRARKQDPFQGRQTACPNLSAEKQSDTV